MDLRTLEDVLALIDTRSLSDAAGLRNITQPAFSRRINKIEADLGLQILDRTHRPASVLPEVRARRDEIERLVLSLRRFRTDMATNGPTINVSAMHGLGLDLVPDAISAAKMGGKLSKVRLHFRDREECFALLMTGQASIMLAYESENAEIVIESELVEKAKLAEDILVPMISQDAVGQVEKAFRENDSIPFIDYPENSFFGAVMRMHVNPQLQMRLATVAVSNFVPSVLAMAERGLGVAWLPAGLVRKRCGGKLADLRAQLGSCKLSLVALRRRFGVNDPSDAIWTSLLHGRIAT